MADFDPIRVILSVRDTLRDIDDEGDQYAADRDELEQLLRWALRRVEPAARTLEGDDLQSIVDARNAFDWLVRNEPVAMQYGQHVKVLSRFIARELSVDVFSERREPD